MHTLPSHQVMYQALVSRDSSFEGIFFVGVKTTGIFCRPTCSARKPKSENCEFFPAASAAIHAGYRPCARCTPLSETNNPPAWLIELRDSIDRSPWQRLRASDLIAQGLSPERVRRQFKQHFGMSFAQYQRARALGEALHELRAGRSVLEAGARNGFESSSGFRDAFRRIFGEPPSDASSIRSRLLCARIESPLGPMLAVASDKGLCLLEFFDRRALRTEIDDLRKRFNSPILPGDNEHLRAASRAVHNYFNTSDSIDFTSGATGSLSARAEINSTATLKAALERDASLHLASPAPLRGRCRDREAIVTEGVSDQVSFDTPGTEFQNRVWAALRTIPSGTTTSYAALAHKLNVPGGPRAIGRAVGSNRIAILIPCHRVVGSDGNLTGYAGGLWRKKWLLEHERNTVNQSQGRQVASASSCQPPEAKRSPKRAALASQA